MSIELRSIRCHHHRVSREPCLNPAVVEVLGPEPNLLCAEHAAALLTETDPGMSHEEGWETFGAEEYARHCEQAVNALESFMHDNGGDEPFADNPVLESILEEALTYLEEYELDRARRALEARGGHRQQTVREEKSRELFEKSLGGHIPATLQAVNASLSEALDRLEYASPEAFSNEDLYFRASTLMAEAGKIVTDAEGQKPPNRPES